MAKTLLEIKEALQANVGKKVKIQANGGRKKMIERSGLLEGIYPAVFTVKLDRDQHSVERLSYSYTDVLTETVKLTLPDELPEEA
ncbi:ABC transporter permease [Salipaludibacillus neizhouensis]|uniref:ABC transporter permease n=1 Tax=Salipaludibacillus neizhouensis TaxID=885475 RepID=A0A3A9JWC1_9BACI|nr:Veg family protein [Salipaludibacillus neizhouensis]RKL65204.1 ABC transporter permease [Salipaludibacillus neizhouensis]